MPDDRKYTEKEKLDWFKKHVEEVRQETLRNGCRDMLPLKSLIAARTAFEEQAAREGKIPDPLPCTGCVFFGRAYIQKCNECCRGKRDFLAEGRAVSAGKEK